MKSCPQVESAAWKYRPTNVAFAASVVICTYSDQRWGALVEAVSSVRAQMFPAMETILVVDHNGGLARRAKRSFPDIFVVENEGARGLSGARNTGVRAAHGEIVAFLDDDARADSRWLAELTSQFQSPDVVGVGGLVEPYWPMGRKPPWMPEEFYWVVGCSYRGLPVDGSPIRNPIGANMAFRRGEVLRAGGFREGIGRIGAVPLGCEETELAIRISRERRGTRIVYSSRARIEHVVDANRTSWRYFVSRCWAEGLSKAAIEAHVGRADALASERQYVVRALASGIARGVASASRGEPLGLARAFAIIVGLTAAVVGYLSGLIRR